MLPKRTTTDPAAAIAVVAVAMVAVSYLLSRQTAIRARRVSMSKDQHSVVEDEHGRHASVPEQLPARGLRDVFWRVVHEVAEDRVAFVAAGVTFYLLLALFPALAALVSLYGLMADPAVISDHLRDLSGMLPPGTFEIFSAQLQILVERRDTTLGIAFLVGLMIAVWSTHNGTLAVFDAMNVAYEENEKRRFFKLNLIAFAFTFCTILAAVFLIGVMALLPAILQLVWLEPWKETLALLVRWPILLVVSLLAMTAIYRFGPSRQPARIRWLTWGALFSTLAWVVMTLCFSWYLDKFADYNATYGALGGLVGFMMWIWLSVCILIVGAELNAELEHQTSRDTTTGAPRPMGARGAYMADNIGRIAS
ncbi:YihY/virulence factor BrkB family protein [Ensifer canadensis]|uniref:YihY/virulence factor BrkB family protein n=1 Tax=Ensifer canadensis TaxID=555315 RepID=UPI001F3A4A30|nr:YihY/virulence factor BrkB family protein [Ensifer canadensis]